MMTATPTPDEAQRALQDIEDRKRQTAAAAASPRWWWIGIGALIAAYGVLVEFDPKFFDTWNVPISGAMVVVATARGSRWGAPLFGRRLLPARPGGAAQQVGGLLVTLIAAVAVMAGWIWLAHRHVTAWSGIGIGLLVALGGPWWERRALQRNARR